MQLRELEILAPAKNRDIGIAAIDCGADALYIAGPSFGARESAGNSMHEVEQLVKYAHRFGAKVYLVINTILYENEIEQAVKLAHEAHRAGCDALIIQDMGLLKAGLPQIPLFASTQTNIRDVKQAVLMESLGFKRAILARELSLSEIAEIKAATTIELETFIHGALCVSYSGQCYISSRVTGRSGNRGECSQMCRSLYTIEDSKGEVIVRDKPILSLKDLNLWAHLPALANAGVTSFKIEGRLKGISYIKNIVRFYRAVADSFMESDGGFKKSSYGKLYGGFTPNPQSTFNRGYTTLFIDSKRESWSSGSSAKSIGEFVGKVASVKNDKFGNLLFKVDSKVQIENGDGLVFVCIDGTVKGMRASTKEGEWVATNERAQIRAGDSLFRNYNHKFEKELETNMPQRLIETSITLTVKEGVTTIAAETEDGRSAMVRFKEIYSVANDIESSLNTIRRQLSKRWGIYKFSCNYSSQKREEVLFYPLSVLNSARRELAELLDEECGKRDDNRVCSTIKLGRPLEGVDADYKYNISNSFAKDLYKQLGAEKISDAFEIAAPKRAELMRCKYCIKFELGYCPAQGGRFGYSEPLFLVNGGRRFEIKFDCKSCEMVILG